MPRNYLTQARYNRTREANRVRWLIRFMTTQPAHLRPDGLPTWWPSYSDSLKARIRDVVRAARRLDHLEAQAHGYTPQLDPPEAP